MKAYELGIPGAWVFEPPVFPDNRGQFAAPFQVAAFREALGFDLVLGQVNQSISARGVIRGVHFSDVPPGQAKYVSCARGSLVDVIVDIRVGSPAFGVVETVEMDPTSGRSVYLAEGLGHAFVALEDDTTMTYLCSTGYNPGSEHGISPLDPELGIPWPKGLPQVLSEKDTQAPTLAKARETGLLPSWDACQELYRSQREGQR
ncbi:dTDP-4-dehydrorhamnose 3,5-epimerase [Pseudonocardia halophobica]|uniref:dTDP-4-dehydrorhamnose 3,5-epimerase n=1 Tax=Pseudonocardia halophobica TaxID=29401 RepID=A0A9W6L2M0_9PSEU|nr:dTDP-4-dehydrorhamnose 3,5-epimerase [Pseudonocardia halophobica]GLL10986.1 dTDP-4-dehydrorhamnose 3,5-epimerase [Pseudonocardia halophobica]